jgi:dUTP pyrophosphatase
MADRPVVRVRRLSGADDLPLPSPATPGASGLDLRAAVIDPLCIAPGERLLVPTGLVLEISSGYEGQVRSRSGIALEFGVFVLNGPGTIDSDYRGEIKVLLANSGTKPFWIRRGDRVAQIVFAPVAAVSLEETIHLEGSERQEGGFGSTGKD